MKLDDINDVLDTDFTSEDYDSIGGIMIECLDHIPKKNEIAVLEDGTQLQASNINKNRILRVIVTLPVHTPADEDEASTSQSDQSSDEVTQN